LMAFSDWLLWSVEGLLLCLLILPAFYFWRFGWPNRKARILANFTEEGVVYYLQRFHRCASRDVLNQVDMLTRGRDDLLADVATAKKDAAELSAQADPATEEARQARLLQLQSQIKETDAKINAVQVQLAAARQNALRFLEDYYDKQFSRSRFVLPFLLLV